MLVESSLNSWLEKTISEICGNGFTDNAKNHCAHFVSHAMNYSGGYNCAGMSNQKVKKAGANVRVHEVFAASTGKVVLETSDTTQSGLVYISAASNFSTVNGSTTLANVPKKHIGFVHAGNVWHYSNTRDKVIKQTLATFINHYSGQTNALWYSDLPAGCNLTCFSGSC